MAIEARPGCIHVVIEIPRGSRNKYEIDHGTGRVFLDRRLFMKFTAFTGCPDPANVAKALAEDGVDGALYLDANDPQGVGIIAVAEDPEYFVTTLRSLFNRGPFVSLVHRPEFDMLGRTYSIGYEPDLEDTLLVKPRQKLLNPDAHWAVWYPLQRAKKFQALPADHQRRILAEHADGSVRLITGEPLPPGWLGKPWACWQGYQRAQGELLLFTDADTRHDDTLLGHAVGAMHARAADMVTVLPRQLLGSFWERLVLPQFGAPTVAGARTTYRSFVGTQELVVVIDAIPCNDTVSGERFESTATVTGMFSTSNSRIASMPRSGNAIMRADLIARATR